MLEGAPIPMHEVRDLRIGTEQGGIGARLYRADARDRDRLVVYFHGGGWVLGSLTSADSVCRFLARHAGVSVLSVDYRLAPEFPFPAAPDDALAAFRFAVARAEDWGHDPALIAVGGDSAGGRTSPRCCARTCAPPRRRGRRSSCCSTRAPTCRRGARPTPSSPTGSS